MEQAETISISEGVELLLHDGTPTLVDKDIYDQVKHLRWTAVYRCSNVYACHRYRINGRVRHLYLHRYVLELSPGDGLVGDHINRNGLDNRRANLRVCTPRENTFNLSVAKNSKTGVRGVQFRKGRYVALAWKDRIRYTVGWFDTLDEASIAISNFHKDLYALPNAAVS